MTHAVRKSTSRAAPAPPPAKAAADVPHLAAIPAPAVQVWGPRRSDVAKTRNCLRCGTAFASQWSGERICGRCKGSAVWREGAFTPRLASARR